MSSLKNAIPRPTHKERAQPHSRAHRYPLLEKRKDYKLRARDHNEKKQRIKILTEKAKGRNEDEFSFGMMSAGPSQGGKMVKKRGAPDVDDRASKGLGMRVETARGFKMQDKAFLRNELGRVRGFIKKVEGGLSIPGENRIGREEAHIDLEARSDKAMDDCGGVQVLGPNHKTSGKSQTQRKTVFVESLPKDPSVDQRDWLEATLDRQGPEPSHAAAAKNAYDPRRRKQHHERLWRLLSRLRDREKLLAQEERELDMQRARMGKSVVGTQGMNKNGVQFRVRGRRR